MGSWARRREWMLSSAGVRRQGGRSRLAIAGDPAPFRHATAQRWVGWRIVAAPRWSIGRTRSGQEGVHRLLSADRSAQRAGGGRLCHRSAVVLRASRHRVRRDAGRTRAHWEVKPLIAVDHDRTPSPTDSRTAAILATSSSTPRLRPGAYGAQSFLYIALRALDELGHVHWWWRVRCRRSRRCRVYAKVSIRADHVASLKIMDPVQS